MKLLSLLLLCVPGGIVDFNKIDSDVVMFDVFLSVEVLEEFNGANVVFGSDTLILESFEYSPLFKDTSIFIMDPPTPAGNFYKSEFYTRGFSDTPYGSNLVFYGTITARAPPGEYDLMVDTYLSSLSLDREVESLYGHVVPEAATIILFGVIGLYLYKTRK